MKIWGIFDYFQQSFNVEQLDKSLPLNVDTLMQLTSFTSTFPSNTCYFHHKYSDGLKTILWFFFCSLEHFED